MEIHTVPSELLQPPCIVTLFTKDPENADFDWDSVVGVTMPVLVLQQQEHQQQQQPQSPQQQQQQQQQTDFENHIHGVSGETKSPRLQSSGVSYKITYQQQHHLMKNMKSTKKPQKFEKFKQQNFRKINKRNTRKTKLEQQQQTNIYNTTLLNQQHKQKQQTNNKRVKRYIKNLNKTNTKNPNKKQSKQKQQNKKQPPTSLTALPPSHNKYSFSVCVAPLFGKVSKRKLMEFIELSHILGFEKIFFYIYDVQPDLLKMLEFYSIYKGIVELIPWPIPTDKITKVWYNGQLIALQDCLYRNMALSERVAFLDLDEVLMPKTEYNWLNLFDTFDQPDRCAFQFAGAYFKPVDVLTCEGRLSADCVVVLSSVKRNKEFDRVRSKCIVKPQLIFEAGIHHISKPLWSHFKTHQIDPSLASLHHYRKCINVAAFRGCKGSEVTERLAEKHSERLLNRLRRVSEELKEWFGLTSPGEDVWNIFEENDEGVNEKSASDKK